MNRSSMRNLTAVGLASAALWLALSGVGSATTGADYGRHVTHCAQEMGFTGQHNPGVHHQGYAGWMAGHDC